MISHRNIADWQGQLADDVEPDEPMFGVIDDRVIDRHLTFLPFGGSTIGPDNVQLATGHDQLT